MIIRASDVLSVGLGTWMQVIGYERTMLEVVGTFTVVASAPEAILCERIDGDAAGLVAFLREWLDRGNVRKVVALQRRALSTGSRPRARRGARKRGKA